MKKAVTIIELVLESSAMSNYQIVKEIVDETDIP
jgi:hypothetical protein